jgi:hypothetical protein
LGTIASGRLFGMYGVEGTLAMSATAAIVAAAAFVISRRTRA